LSAEIAALVRSAGLPHVDTVATSLGCMVAAQTLGDHGIPYGRAVLIGAFTVLDSRRLRLTNRIVSLLPRRLYQLGAPLLMAWVCGPVGNGRRHPFFGWIRRSDPTQVVKRTRWEIDRDFALELKKLTRPTLVLMGSEDRFVRDVDTEVAAITRALSHPESEVRMVPDAGHVFLPSGAAQTAVRAIRMFLNYSKEEV
jgi:pimeloyl-ACP methyl ester carboxylesterase